MGRTLVEPRLGQSFETSSGSFYPDRVTFSEATKVRNSVGTEVATWADISGMVNVPARIAPEARLSRDEEIRTPDLTYQDLRRRVALPGEYVIDSMWRMHDVERDLDYNIIRVDSGAMTFLTVELRR